MFAGHFALAAAVRSKSQRVPLWALMLGTQLIDILFVPLYLTNYETIKNVTDSNYGEGIIYAFYSHSLIGTLFIAFLAGLLSSCFWGRKGSLIFGSVIFSHWLLDLLVHRKDLAIFPGNLGELPLLGFGLWKYERISILIESALIIGGAYMYFKYVLLRGEENKNQWSIGAGTVMAFLLMLSLISDVMGI